MIKFKAIVYQKGNKVGETYEFNRKSQKNAQDHLDSITEELERKTGVIHEWEYSYIENLNPQENISNKLTNKKKSTSKTNTKTTNKNKE